MNFKYYDYEESYFVYADGLCDLSFCHGAEAGDLRPFFNQVYGGRIGWLPDIESMGYGRNRSDAKEQAIKNAVWAVVFDGIREGVSGCNMRPLVTEVNARERYEDYFNVFFADGGEYKKYVTLRDTKKRSANKSKDKVGYSYEMTIRVLRSQLKARLKADNVIDKDHL